MYLEKTVKLNKKVKLKSLKQVIDQCLENKFDFSFDESFLTVSDKDFNEASFAVKDFGKELTIKSAFLEFDDNGIVDSETYDLGKRVVISSVFSIFFTGFPKLTEAQKTPTPIPPPPTILNKMDVGEAHDRYDFKYLENNTLEVGCSTFNRKQMKKIFNFLGECLDIKN